MPVVRVDRLSYSYPGRVALQGISFEVEGGEIFGLLGPNGGGKSTTFRILSTFLPAPAGAVFLFEEDASTHAASIRGKMGVVFQSGSLDRKLSVTENLRHQGHLYGMKGAGLNERIRELLQRFGLEDRAKDSVEKLSGGMKRRVEIAKGILHRPQLLILDEPSTGLDPAVRLELWQTLEDLRSNDGVTVLITTHFMEEAERCDRLAILDRGVIVTMGKPAQLKAEVGGEVLEIRSREINGLLLRMKADLGLPAVVINGSIRVEKPEAHKLVSQLMERYGNQIDTITLGRPTLEDVFVHRTGRKLEES